MAAVFIESSMGHRFRFVKGLFGKRDLTTGKAHPTLALMATEPSGAGRLLKALRPRMTVAELAKELDVSTAAVNYWLRGKTTPARKYREKLERLLGIPADSWRNGLA